MSENNAETKKPFAEEQESSLCKRTEKLFGIEDAPFSRTARGKEASYVALGRKDDVVYRELEGAHLRFELHKKIGGLTYCFKIFKEEGDKFGINIETEEYDFALTQLSKEEQAEYFETIRAMVEKINAESPVVKMLVISTAGEAYTAKEIDACKKALLAEDEKLTRQELDEMYGFEILRSYEKLHGKPFPLERSQDPEEGITPRDARSRFFRIYFKKYFPDWEIHPGYAGRDFSLVKKSQT
ncbi:MAG: hypothetical protein AAB869_02980 [Patescibacteria group bacterium]